jgi:hypothetical protein
MEIMKINLLFIFLILSVKLFSQTISELNLTGTWKSDAEYDDTTQLIFFNDPKVMVTHRWEKEVFPFELIQFGADEVIILKHSKGDKTIAVYTAYVRKTNENEIEFQELQIHNSDAWIDGLKNKIYRRQVSKPEDVFN